MQVNRFACYLYDAVMLYARAMTEVLSETSEQQILSGYNPLSDGKRIVANILGKVYHSKSLVALFKLIFVILDIFVRFPLIHSGSKVSALDFWFNLRPSPLAKILSVIFTLCMFYFSLL